MILTVFNNDGSAQLDVPQPPHTLRQLTENDPNKELTKSEKFKKFRQKLSHKRKQAEMYSLWCDALYRLSLANHVSNTYSEIIEMENYKVNYHFSLETKYSGYLTIWIFAVEFIQFHLI